MGSTAGFSLSTLSMMKRLAAFLPWLLLCAIGSSGARASDFPSEGIDAVTRAPALRHALWGILVEEESGKVLYERNADTMMVPASVRKLFTGASVLSCHGVDGTLETRVGLTGVQKGSVLRGDLVIRGGGDPSLAGRWEYDSDRNARLRPIVEALARLGIDRIDGDVVIDVSAFDDVLIPGSWKKDYLGNSWAAPVDAVAYNENVIGVRVVGRPPSSAIVTLDPEFAAVAMEERCSKTRHVVGIVEGNVVTVGCSKKGKGTLSYLVAVPDPALFAGQGVRAFLLDHGVSIRGVRTTREAVTGARTLTVIPSPPAGMLLSAVLSDSANLYAEMLLKSMSLGEGPASYEESLGIERAFLERVVALGGAEFSFDDGSGLSTENGVTPRATLRLIAYLERDASRLHLFRDSLASPGFGTLRKRLGGLEGRVVAKTGSIDGVKALAGWAIGEKGAMRRFAIFINNHTAPGKSATDAIDQIVRLIADF